LVVEPTAPRRSDHALAYLLPERSQRYQTSDQAQVDLIAAISLRCRRDADKKTTGISRDARNANARHSAHDIA